MKNILLLNLILATSLQSVAIMNGRAADATLSVATVTLHLKGADRDCTGVVVHPNLIFTAGHCTDPANQSTVMEISNEVNGSNKRTVKANWKTAPGYTTSDVKEPSEIQNDFAYIKTSTDLVSLLGIDPAQLPKVGASMAEIKTALAAANGQAVAYGYGVYDRKGHIGLKKELQSKIFIIENLNILQSISVEPTAGQCEGDSGGGIFVRATNGQPLLLGNLSGIAQKKGCGSEGSYAAYTISSKHVCWAQSKSGVNLGMSCN